jgi:hypothetical protein
VDEVGGTDELDRERAGPERRPPQLGTARVTLQEPHDQPPAEPAHERRCGDVDGTDVPSPVETSRATPASRKHAQAMSAAIAARRTVSRRRRA